MISGIKLINFQNKFATKGDGKDLKY